MPGEFYVQDSNAYGYTSMKSLNEPKHGFWGILARKAKAILEDENATQQFDENGRNQLQMVDLSTRTRVRLGKNIEISFLTLKSLD